MDAQGNKGAMACVVVPWFTDRYQTGADWRCLAYWIHDYLPYNRLQFFRHLCAFNIGWREDPHQAVSSFIDPKGALFRNGMPERGQFAHMYADFPEFKHTKV